MSDGWSHGPALKTGDRITMPIHIAWPLPWYRRVWRRLRGLPPLTVTRLQEFTIGEVVTNGGGSAPDGAA